jgi:hypothetical protein
MIEPDNLQHLFNFIQNVLGKGDKLPGKEFQSLTGKGPISILRMHATPTPFYCTGIFQ